MKKYESCVTVEVYYIFFLHCISCKMFQPVVWRTQCTVVKRASATCWTKSVTAPPPLNNLRHFFFLMQRAMPSNSSSRSTFFSLRAEPFFFSFAKSAVSPGRCPVGSPITGCSSMCLAHQLRVIMSVAANKCKSVRLNLACGCSQ